MLGGDQAFGLGGYFQTPVEEVLPVRCDFEKEQENPSLGLALVSWTRRGFDTRQGRPDRVLERLTRDLSAGDILLLHDGNAARTAAGEPVILQVLPDLIERCHAAGLRPVRLSDALPDTRAHG